MPSSDEQREYERFHLYLPVRGRVKGGSYHGWEIVDISSAGIQLRSPSTDGIAHVVEKGDKRVHVEICVPLELVWSDQEPGESVTSGWKFVNPKGNREEA